MSNCVGEQDIFPVLLFFLNGIAQKYGKWQRIRRKKAEICQLWHITLLTFFDRFGLYVKSFSKLLEYRIFNEFSTPSL